MGNQVEIDCREIARRARSVQRKGTIAHGPGRRCTLASLAHDFRKQGVTFMSLGSMGSRDKQFMISITFWKTVSENAQLPYALSECRVALFRRARRLVFLRDYEGGTGWSKARKLDTIGTRPDTTRDFARDGVLRHGGSRSGRSRQVGPKHDAEPEDLASERAHEVTPLIYIEVEGRRESLKPCRPIFA